MSEKFTPPEQFRLTDAEKTSSVWLKLKAHLDEKLKEKRGKNDDLALDPIKTAAVRGHIECLKGLLSLGDVPPVIND